MPSPLANELIELEKQFWQAMKDRDVAAAVALTHDPCIVAGPQGVSSIDHATFGRMMEGGKWTLPEFDLRDVRVQELGDDVAVIGYKVHEKLTVDGKPITLDAADASTWVRRNGRWLCAMHTESLAGDPYGRDRQRAP